MRFKNGFHARHAVFPVFHNAANAIYQGYMSLYWTHLGFSEQMIGQIGAISAAAAILAQPIWGRLGDRMRHQNRLLAILSASAAAALLPALFGRGFLPQAACAAAFFALFSALLPLGDAILLESGGGFGTYRLAGGIAFALAGLAFGVIFLPNNAVVAVIAALAFFSAIGALLLPDTRGRNRGAGMLSLLKNRNLTRLLLFLLPVQATMACYYTVYAPRFEAIGGSRFALGLGYLIASASEAPYLLLSEKIYRRFGAAKPMCVAAGILAVRWWIVGFARTPVPMLLAQALHGGGLTVLSVSMARWIADNVPNELRAAGQTLLNMAAFGASRLIGSFGAGLLADAFGSGAAFRVCAGVCAISAVCFAGFAFRRNR